MNQENGTENQRNQILGLWTMWRTKIALRSWCHARSSTLLRCRSSKWSSQPATTSSTTSSSTSSTSRTYL